jgi:hypothetical protein
MMILLLMEKILVDIQDPNIQVLNHHYQMNHHFANPLISLMIPSNVSLRLYDIVQFFDLTDRISTLTIA